jgi:2-oxoglutarate ferredoxin oxidoreductase subunit alpha
MVEGIGLAGITETPVVVVDAQRPGPGIGLPTRTEQCDLEFVLHPAHGEFPLAVLAPGTVEEAFWLTIKAFNLAEKFQIPVILLTDQHLASSYQTVKKIDLSKVNIERGLLTTDSLEQYRRHQITKSGVSPRAFPMQSRALVVTDSDEHDENGHMIDGAEIRTQMMQKRLKKIEGLRNEINSPRVYGPSKADTALIGWGSTYGALKETVDNLRNEGMDINLIHFSEIWPFPADSATELLKNSKKTYVVENNATGQLARIIRGETGINVTNSILKFDGRPFSPNYIAEELGRRSN